ncbi:MAG TPA: universal stress protein [Candidatus Acidoferrales bacterium]|nr:universal stress protein [Candidatus Acidoferrales bacterium]
MSATQSSARITVKNVLFLTDFSDPSEAALPLAFATAREYGATVHALHVLVPQSYMYTAPDTTAAAIEAQEENAQSEMQRVESKLAGVTHDVRVVRGIDVWAPVEEAIESCHADLIILGTHGRAGAQKMILGSVAEEVFRRSPVPVLTVGPRASEGMHGAARFHRVLHATDFSPEARYAAPYAVSLAQENQAHLVLLHVMDGRRNHSSPGGTGMSIAVAMHELLELVPSDAELWCRPEPVVQYGQVAERILEEAKGRHADLIVLGVRGAAGHLRAATHFRRSVAYQVVANARCPVLTVRA